VEGIYWPASTPIWTIFNGLYFFAQKKSHELVSFEKASYLLEINILIFRFSFINLYAIHIFIPFNCFLIYIYQLKVKDSIEYKLAK
jgi:hypothetical protein